MNEDELPHECAVREVIEETNCDVASLIDSRHFLEKVINDQGRTGLQSFATATSMLYRVGLSIGRKVLKVMFWEVPPAGGPLL